MRKTVMFVAIALLATMASEARAQARAPQAFQPFDGKLLVIVNLGIQVGDNDLSNHTTFDLYDETAEVQTNQTINNGFFFEIGGAYRIRPDYGAGVAWSILSNSGPGTISGTLPHPLLFEEPRSFSASVDDLKHTEQALHFQVLYFYPFVEKVDFTFSGGPSVFFVSQGLIRGVMFTEIPPNFTSVTIDSVDVVELSKSGWGFNIGADVNYALTDKFHVAGHLFSIGVGGLLRYTHGAVTFDLAEGQTAKVSTGGFQIAGGVRFRF
jgi:hypothetical protein